MHLSAHAQSDDLVICSAPYSINNIRYYLKNDPSLQVIGYPVDGKTIKSSDLASDFESILKDEERFWLFLNRTYYCDPEGNLRIFFDSHRRRILELERSGIELALYMRDET